MKKYDRSRMYAVYDQWPRLAEECYDSIPDELDFKNIDHVIFSGMGGSGTICDIFSSILSKSNMHVCVVKGYHLPKTIDNKTLIVCSSVSGNTSETLQVLKSASKLNCKIVAFSSGGKMEQYCIKNRITYKKLQHVNSPRASLPLFLYSMLKYLKSNFHIPQSDVKQSIDLLYRLNKKITSTNLTSSNISLNLASWITGIPMIYYPWGLNAAAIRFKNSLQENTKIHVMAEDVMEASHNGIVSWERPSNIQPIMIQGQNDHIKTKERWKIFKEYFKENNIPYYEIFSMKGSILSKLINLIYVLDYSTIYKAVLDKIDPTPIYSINYIKERLS